MTIAVVGAGGLVPAKSEQISIEREDLYISPRLIRVDYLFRNASSADIVAPILFPLPEIDALRQHDDSFVAAINNDDGPAVEVSVMVMGKPVDVLLQQRAYSRNGDDITERLKTLGLDMLGGHDLNDRLKKLPSNEVSSLKSSGLLEKEGDYYLPNWVVRGAYQWNQKFQSNSQTKVHIEYAPLTGGMAASMRWSASDRPERVESELAFSNNRQEAKAWEDSYCFGQDIITSLAGMPRKFQEDGPDITVEWTRYVLLSAVNWAGPIGAFHLTVDKLDADAVIAFCAPDGKSQIKQTGRTTYEVEIKNFTPSVNFSLMTVTPAK
ncbi:MAG: DUF4424 family protein [Alphaproteobacteria bacterium]|nr:DUF4424 family protein [Alphaproteobacteria bacterium]